jgi:hypothetical protein
MPLPVWTPRHLCPSRRLIMDAPPNILDYYGFETGNITNPGSQACVFAWADLRRFWGGVANQCWSDLDAVQSMGLTG